VKSFATGTDKPFEKEDGNAFNSSLYRNTTSCRRLGGLCIAVERIVRPEATRTFLHEAQREEERGCARQTVSGLSMERMRSLHGTRTDRWRFLVLPAGSWFI